MIDKLLEKIKDKTYDARGGNNVCYLIDDYALLYGSICHEEIDDNMRLVNEYIKKGVRTPRIIEYKYDQNSTPVIYSKTYQKGYLLEEKAVGKELYTREYAGFNDLDTFDDDYLKYIEVKNNYLNVLKDYSLIPKEHLEKFIKDYLLIEKEDTLDIDPSKASNFFYDKEKGFTFIDLNYGGRKDYPDDIFLIELFTNLFPSLPMLEISNKDNISYTIFTSIYLTKEEQKEIINYRLELFSKISSILNDLGFDKDLINKTFNDRNNFDYVGIFDNQDDLDDALLKNVRETLRPISR